MPFCKFILFLTPLGQGSTDTFWWTVQTYGPWNLSWKDFSHALITSSNPPKVKNSQSHLSSAVFILLFKYVRLRKFENFINWKFIFLIWKQPSKNVFIQKWKILVFHLSINSRTGRFIIKLSLANSNHFLNQASNFIKSARACTNSARSTLWHLKYFALEIYSPSNEVRSKCTSNALQSALKMSFKMQWSWGEDLKLFLQLGPSS